MQLNYAASNSEPEAFLVRVPKAENCGHIGTTMIDSMLTS